MENNILYMAEHPEHGIWYFTNLNKLAKYIGTTMAYILYRNRIHNYDGWTITEVDGSDVMYKYINPER